MMRVLHLIPTLGGGGAERQLGLLAPALAQSGMEIGVAFHGGGPNLDLLRKGPVDLLPLPGRGNHHPMQISDIWSVVRYWQPDAIQTWLPQMDILGGLVAHLTRKPQILSERSSADMYGEGWKIRARVQVGKKAHAIIANSQGGADYWRDLGARGQIAVIPNALAPPKSDVSVHPWEGKPYFVMAGRLAFEKNTSTAVKALVIALEALPHMQAVILGEGPERAMVEEIIRSSTVASRIRLIGYSGDLENWLRNGTAYISASHVEGHPNIVLEAAQLFCPLILSDIPAHRHAIGEGAAYVAADNVAGFASELQSVVSGRNETFRRLELARSKVDTLKVDAIADHYIRFYQKHFETALR